AIMVPAIVLACQKGIDAMIDFSHWARSRHKNPWTSPAADKSMNMSVRPIVESQKFHELSAGLYQLREHSFGQRYVTPPIIQKPNTPNMTRWACPTTQSLKWMILWNGRVV